MGPHLRRTESQEVSADGLDCVANVGHDCFGSDMEETGFCFYKVYIGVSSCIEICFNALYDLGPCSDWAELLIGAVHANDGVFFSGFLPCESDRGGCYVVVVKLVMGNFAIFVEESDVADTEEAGLPFPLHFCVFTRPHAEEEGSGRELVDGCGCGIGVVVLELFKYAKW